MVIVYTTPLYTLKITMLCFDVQPTENTEKYLHSKGPYNGNYEDIHKA